MEHYVVIFGWHAHAMELFVFLTIGLILFGLFLAIVLAPDEPKMPPKPPANNNPDQASAPR